MNGKYIKYLRVSTKTQGQSGLGLEAQEAAITQYLNGGTWEVIAEFMEVESGKRDDNRPKLQCAIQLAKATGAKLLIAKLDRLSRNAAFLMSLNDSGVDFVCCDNPNANKLTIGILALVAQDEAERISLRTKQALAAAKERGVKLGGANDRVPTGHLKNYGNKYGVAALKKKAQLKADELRSIVEPLLTDCLTLNDIALRLMDMGVLTPRGGGKWYSASVSRLLNRLGLSLAS
ncbi:recombinase family protein [Solidesulfovibrio sp. C21]|uniref:recombinase family protein n=1 Tax=Solidesulfovibrio sp. C21 TaxID=3398613 RepID=UPI0039FC10B7